MILLFVNNYMYTYKGKKYNNFVFKKVNTNRKLYKHLQDYIKTYESTNGSNLIDYSLFKEHFVDDGYCLTIAKTGISMRYEKFKFDGSFYNLDKLPDSELILRLKKNGEFFNSMIENLSHNNYLLYYYGLFMTIDEVKDTTYVYCLFENLVDTNIHNHLEDTMLLVTTGEDEKHEIYYEKLFKFLSFCKKMSIIFDIEDVYIVKIYQHGVLIHYGLKLSPSSTVKVQKDLALFEKFMIEAINKNNMKQFKQLCDLVDVKKFIPEIIKQDKSEMLAYIYKKHKKSKLSHDEENSLILQHNSTKCKKWLEYYALSSFDSETL